MDLNRAGAGLMEIVSGPQLRTPGQAGAYIRKLQELLRRVGASDGNMEEGSLRCDVNVSVGKIGEAFGTRCEVKNVNGVKFVMNAISFEIQRQFELLSQGKQVQQQTRAYDEQTGTTIFLRSKEDAPDYRYMPDPNLPPIVIDPKILEEFRQRMPEHPDEQRVRLMQQYKLSVRDTNVLMRVGLEEDRHAAGRGDQGAKPGDAVKYFEEVAKGRNPQTAANWVIHELMKALNARGQAFSPKALPTARLGELIDLVEDGKVTITSAKSFLPELLDTAESNQTTGILSMLTDRGLLAMSGDGTEMTDLCKQIIQDLPKEAEKVRAGNEKVVARLMGEAMKRTKGRADARAVRETFSKLLQK